jgi:hypothetical protein
MQATVKEGSRVGRGFSIAELKEAGLDIRIARNNGVPTDVWRDTKYPENVEKLRSLAKSVKETKKEVKKKPEPTPNTSPKATPKPKTTKRSTKKKTTKKKQKKRKK